MRALTDRQRARLAELESLMEENGGVLPPASVVDYARDPATALHEYFEWDDAAAGEKYRIDQARTLIRATVTVQNINNRDRRIQAFVSIIDDRRNKGGGYRTTVEVMSSEQMRERMLETAKMELAGFKKRYRDLTELADLFEVIDRVLAPQSKEHPTEIQPSA